MINIIVRSFLGHWGGQVLDFYIANSLWINGLLLLYFLLVVLGRRNYRVILFSLVKGLEGKQTIKPGNKNAKQIGAALKKQEIPWEVGLRASAFPFITPPQGFRIYLKSQKRIQDLIPREILVDTLIERSALLKQTK